MGFPLNSLQGAALVASASRSPDLENLNPEVVKLWEGVQSAFGRELPINSGYRGALRNKQAGGAKRSQHMDGNALDIDVSSLPQEDRLKLIEIASGQGFGGIGVYDNALHFDIGPKRYWGPSHKAASLPTWAAGTISKHMKGGFPMQSGGGVDEAVGGNASDYTLEQIDQEIARRQGGQGYSLQDIDAEIAKRKVAAEGPSEQDRIDVEHALSQMQAEQNPARAAITNSPVATAANTAGDSLMFGFGDNVAAGMDVAADAVLDFLGLSPETPEGQEAVRGYREHLERRRGLLSDQRENNPNAALAGDITGAITGASGLAKGGVTLLNRAATTSGKVLAGAGEGAAYGAAHAAGQADGENVAGEAAEGAVGGAVLGGILSRAGVGFERYLEKRQLLKAAKGNSNLKALSQELFDAAAQSNIVYKPASVDDMVLNLAADLADETIDSQIHPKASRALKRLFEMADRPATLKEMERFRKLASDAAQAADSGSADQRLAQMIRDRLDDFSLDQVNMIAPDEGAKLQKEARRLWHQYRKDEQIAEAVERAVRRAASSGSGGNVNNAIRQNLRAILDNKRLIRGFTKDERAALEKVVKGAPIDDLLRLAGKLSPSGNGLMLGLNLGGAAAFGPETLAVGAMSQGAKALADRGTTQRVKALAGIIRAGGTPPAAKMRRLSAQERKALSNLVSGELGEATGEPLVDEIRSLVTTGRN